MRSTRLAKGLSPGDGIGFFSPSSPATSFAPKRFARAKAFLQSKGFTLVEGALTGKSDGYRSGSIEARADEFNALIRNPDVCCIMSTIGGSNSNALLPYIDYEALLKDPKIIVGYSDVTALLLGIYAQTGLVTYYGPALVASFGELSPIVDQTYASFETLLMGSGSESHVYAMPEQWTEEFIPWEDQVTPKSLQQNAWDFLGQGGVSGRLIGGNLNTMAGIWGSPYMPSIEPGDILLLEDSLKSIATVERAFSHLKACGVFDEVGAIVLGKHEGFDDKGTGRRPLDVLREVLGSQALPVLSGFDSCHTHPMLVMPIGCRVKIDFDAKSIGLVEPWIT